MNLKAVHYALLAIAAIVAVSQFVAAQFPQYAPLAHAVAGFVGSLSATLGILSPSALTPAVAAPVPLPASVEAAIVAAIPVKS